MKQRLAIRLVFSHLLVILVVSGIASVVLLTQSRQYFVNADRRALLIQAQVAAKNCDAVCLADGVGTFNVSNAQIPPAAVISQNRSYAESNLSLGPDVQSGGPTATPDETLPAKTSPARSGPVTGRPGDPTGAQVAGQSRIQASLGNDVRILRVADPANPANPANPVDSVKGPTGATQADTIGALALKGRSSSGTIGRDIVAAAPIMSDGKIVGAVEVRSDLRNVEGVLGDLRRRILAAVAGSALLAALLGLWRARSIARPLRELTNAARGLADGNFTQTLPQPKGHDELALLTATFSDMRDRVQHELAVRNAFVADASHELRTPLTAIRGAVEILQDGGAERPEVRDRFLQTLGNETNRLLGLVDGLLQLETNDQGFATAEIVELSSLIGDVALQMQPIAQSKLIRIVWDSDVEEQQHGRLSIQGDSAKLRQVLVNLLDNAITYSPRSTIVKISLTTNVKSTHRIIEVTDQGPGIPEADRERVFERFVRLDHSRNRLEQNQLQQSQVQQNQVQQNQVQQSQMQQSQMQQSETPHSEIQHSEIQPSEIQHNQKPMPRQAQPTSSATIKPGGAGLGLAIARSIVQAHGGTLSFHGGHNGVGITARVELAISKTG